jgi:nucleotide sugar dehydrogenase
LLTGDNDIDYTALDSASADVARGLRTGTLVSYETTLPVGGCREHLRPILERGGLKAGADFHLVFSPERVKSKLIFEKLGVTPKVVGGLNATSEAAGAQFYARYLATEVIEVGSLEAAEFVKLSGMIYRDVNIALANELGRFAETNGINFWPVLAAANTDSETALLRPSIGVGGHCTPVYPHFFISDAKRKQNEAHFARLARQVNDRQPAHQLARLESMLEGLAGKTVHILGLAFRPGVREEAMSPAFQLRDALNALGASVTLEDPLYSDAELTILGFVPARVLDGGIDAVVLNTAHDEFLEADFDAWRAGGVSAVLDGQNVWSSDAALSAGLTYVAVGVPA